MTAKMTKTPKKRPLTDRQRESLSRRHEHAHKATTDTAAYRQRQAIAAEARVQTQQSMLVNRMEAYQANRANKNQSELQQRQAIQKLNKPSLGQRAGSTLTGNDTAAPTAQVQSGGTTVAGTIFRVFAVLIGMAILYTLVKNQGHGGSTFINAVGKSLTTVTSGKPMFNPVSGGTTP